MTDITNNSVVYPKSFLDCAVRPFNDEEGDNFITLCMGEQSIANVPVFNEHCKVGQTDVGKILLQRLSLNSEVTISEPLALWILSLCDRPGLIVMWAYTLVRMQQRNPGKILNMTVWTHHFPSGLPTNQAMIDAWNGQKSDMGGNLLDTREVWTHG